MSIVAVHGPNTFGSRAIVGNSVMTATVNPANAIQWTFIPVDKTQVAANYDWAYTGPAGSPASPVLNTMTPTVTFTGSVAGDSKTVTLTLNGVAQPPLTFKIPSTGVGSPSLRSLPPGEEEEETVEGEDLEIDVGYDPAAHTVEEVLAFVEEHPDQAAEMLAAEQEGKARVTLVTQLEELAFDPADHTVTEVISFVEDHPERLDDVIAAEQADKNRVTLISHLESMRPE